MEAHDPSAVTRERLGNPPGPCVMVMFGAGGDLTKRKLMPAIYNLAKGKLLPEHFAIVGISIEQYSDDQFRQRMTEDVREFYGGEFDTSVWDWFVKRLYYLSGDFKDPALYSKLGEQLTKVEGEQGTEGNRLFYLATSPTFFPIIVQHLGSAGL